MNILVACEESQAVTIELRKLGHNAFSCDIEPCSGGHPEWHIQGDVLPLVDGNCWFYTQKQTDNNLQLFSFNRTEIYGQWDMLIAFPPCTDLAVSGAAWFEQKRKDGRQQKSIEFFMKIANADCPRIAIENPVGIMSTIWRKPDQIIHPWQYGHKEQKSTCLWLNNLPLLVETKNVKAEMSALPKNQRERLHYLPPSPDRAKLRSKTYLGIARAMATQWAGDS